jgi:protein SCO1/2
MSRSTLILILCGTLLATSSLCKAQESPRVGIDEHLGERIPLENLDFTDENGQPIALRSLFDKPVVLTLVYYRCPGICTPLLQELADVANKCEMEPGEDYRMVTISFEPNETAELARNKQANMIATLTNKQVSTDDWRFLTGDAENIQRITEAVGFLYTPDENKVDYVHAATVMFISTEGKIARYLNGTQFNPADFKMAVIDATEGRARSFMQKIQQICYAYDPEGRAYVLKVNRLILGATLLFVAGFGAFLLFRGLGRKQIETPVTGDAS